MSPPPYKAAIAAAVLMGAAGAAPSAAAEPVTVGYVLGFRSPAMAQDYRIAIELMMKRVFKSFGQEVEMRPYETPDDVLAAFWAGEVDITELSSLEHALLPESRRAQLKVTSVVVLDEGPTSEYRLLAKKGETLESLKGKRVRLCGRGDWNLGIEWLDQHLVEEVGAPAFQHFGSCELVDFEEAGDLVLPTFFGKADACLVMGHQFDLLSELNPQLGKTLVPIAVSPPMLNVLFVHRTDFSKMDHEEFADISASLHTKPDGAQGFTLMKIKRLMRISAGELERMRPVAERIRLRRGATVAELLKDFESQ